VTRDELLNRLEAHYRESGWPVRARDDSTIRATGPGGVTWIGMAIVAEDLSASDIDDRLLALSDERMHGGRVVCPFELLPAPECADELRDRLRDLHVADRGHVTVYSAAA
jgi:hypothetical protein